MTLSQVNVQRQNIDKTNNILGTRPSGVGVEYATEHKQQCKVSNPCTDGSNPCPGNSECIYLDPTMSPPFMCKVCIYIFIYGV